MPRRQVIRIDEEKCDGCGLCVTACAEGAIEVVDGKARLVSETYCDGLGACLGECPQGAITLESIAAAPFDESAVADHLARRRASDPQRALSPSVQSRGGAPLLSPPAPHAGGCPGSRALSFSPVPPRTDAAVLALPSQLRQWPVQLHLLSPQAPYLRDADLLLAADCVAFALGDFHRGWLAGRSLAIACPKLDTNQDSYLEKLAVMAGSGGVRSLTVMVMEVPCCGGLVRLAQQAVAASGRSLPLTVVVVSVQGQILATRELSPASAHA